MRGPTHGAAHRAATCTAPRRSVRCLSTAGPGKPDRRLPRAPPPASHHVLHGPLLRRARAPRRPRVVRPAHTASRNNSSLHARALRACRLYTRPSPRARGAHLELVLLLYQLSLEPPALSPLSLAGRPRAPVPRPQRARPLPIASKTATTTTRSARAPEQVTASDTGLAQLRRHMHAGMCAEGGRGGADRVCSRNRPAGTDRRSNDRVICIRAQ